MNFKWALLLCGAALLAATSCSKDDERNIGPFDNDDDYIIIDYSPVILRIQVLSPHGYSTLPNLDLSNVSAEFQGKSYYCGMRPTATRYYAPDFYGLKVQGDYLFFGELDGAKSYDHEQLIINWGNESIKNDTIVFSRNFIDAKNIEMDYWVNGTHIRHIAPGEDITEELGHTTEWAASKGFMALYKDLSALNSPNLNETTPIPLTEIMKGIALQNNHFQINLLHTMLASVEKNLVASPLSVAYLLAMLASGCGEGGNSTVPTAVEVLLALEGYPDHTCVCFTYCDGPQFRQSHQNLLLQTVMQHVHKCDPKVELTIANALFARKEFTPNSSYVDYIADSFRADYEQLDFDSPTALQAINNWSYQKSRGKIPEILSDINPQAVAYALNAIYFKAPWTAPFDEKLTQPALFHKADGTTAEVQMMYNLLPLNYYESDNLQAVQLPFANGAFNMTIVLPKEGWSLSQLTDYGYGLTMVTNLNSMEQDTKRCAVSIALPRFSIETANDQLAEQLKQISVQSLFDPSRANLSWISDKPLYVSKMLQKARIDVNEVGCEAAAVTAAEVTSGMNPEGVVEFRADRPFLYFITERSSSLIFFAGAYCGD